MRISIGIHVHEEPTRLIATLESVKLNSEPETELLLLKDGPDPATCATLARLSGFVQLGTSKRLGPSACFNKLAANCDAEVLVLLESGSIVGPGWIHRILAAMAADPNIGLAGPTTNHVWNEQGVCRKSSGSPEEVAHTAREVAHRFGFAVRTLEPLYSLADFCYVVRREVIDVVGAADEQYANGPCWEMDYNIRAARAGFMGIWVCGAYVHRLPITKKRIQDEISLTEANKRRYQDKFCRMKLEAKTGDYCQHCQGDACDNFAPKELIQIQLPINQAANPDLGRKKKDRALDLTDPVDLPSVSEAENCPLVSCIMPTYNRRPFVSLAIKYFLHQDYPNRELIIVDDGTDPIVDLVPENPCIRYIRLEQKTTIGAKRNLACKEARGDIVMHWGDDDWMSNWRIRYQVKSLSKKQADICGLKRVFFCDLERGEAWQYSYSGKGKAWVAGGTLCYKKSFWSANPFPEICDGEDTHFIWSDHSKRVLALEDSTFYVALIHSETTRHKRKANLLWHPHTTEEIQKIIGKDWDFYSSLIKEKRCPETSIFKIEAKHIEPVNGHPMISCIMPTCNRRLFVSRAIKYFICQDYPNKELIIVDDGKDAIQDLIPNTKEIKYFRLPQKTSIGVKRNIAVEESKGEIIAHWDDDDWYHSRYLHELSRPLLRSYDQHTVTGLATYLVYILESGSLKICRTRSIAGATFCYFKKLWKKFPYRDAETAEDYFFMRDAQPHPVHLDNPELFIVIRHKNHTWEKEKGINVNEWMKRLTNYPKRLYEIAEQDDCRFYERARNRLYPSFN